MTIIEFAHIKLADGVSAMDPSLQSNMKRVKEVIEAYNHLPTNFLVEQEDPSIMYVVGSWESMEQHSKGFSGSRSQQEILDLVKDQMSIDWQQYIDLEYANIPLDAPVLSIATYALAGAKGTSDQKAKFQKAFTENEEFLKAIKAAPGLKGRAGGWNIPKAGEDILLWVQFSGWTDLDCARSFYASRECQEILDTTEQLGIVMDMKHGSLYKLSP